MRVNSIVLGFIMVGSQFIHAVEPKEEDKYWSQWRGPNANGSALVSNPPTEWSEEKNIKWKIPIAGSGYASPVIWQNQVFLLTAVEVENPDKSIAKKDSVKQKKRFQFKTISIDAATGAVNWEKISREAVPHEGIHRAASWASASAVTDGKHVVASFGSNGIYCYDMSGNLIWEKDLGEMKIFMGQGEGSSPALYDNAIVVQWDHQGQSYLFALDKQNGKELWKVERDVSKSWATPIVVEVNGSPQVITNGEEGIHGYAFHSGQLIWSFNLPGEAIPTPLHKNGLLYAQAENILMAIKLEQAKGDITKSDAIVWKYERDTPWTPSPVLYNGQLYFHKGDGGIVSSINAADGSLVFGPSRLPGIKAAFSSPVAAADHVYFSGRNGTVVVLNAGSSFEIKAQNKLDDKFDASPAIQGDILYLRGHKYLYCIEKMSSVPAKQSK